ncbi:MAG: metallophosphoesterase [Nanoarchaeota archaeon]|nr:metallophosphoesterase [Nanoarchaeota archaeon]MBU1445260.1 metallophosphoesterase [Nanoarchaeota archaeon]MBU2406624.1 metallophosphoesterase [Nanoarchaeota archaeon]MBU2420210.1 metallophosphoesterase [Nanoarchaeota archaeon]MBU2475062.1 metallophosphoesterase [Nanoarchaeota archaeon]
MKKSVIIVLFLVFSINLANAFPDFTSLDLLGRPTENSITINLINGPDPISAYIEYGILPGNYTNSTEVQNINPNELLEFDIENLNENTQYYYILKAKLQSETEYSSSIEKTFRTKRNGPFSFTLFTDSHIDLGFPDNAIRLSTIIEGMSLNDNSDLSFFLGDNIQIATNGSSIITNESEAIQEYEIFRNALTSLNIPAFFTVGNWEGEPGWEAQEDVEVAINLRKKYFSNPLDTTYSESGSANEDYYAFTWGNALFIVLNVMSYTETDPFSNHTDETWTLGETQLNWLNSTLQNATEPWKFIMIHHTVGGYWPTWIWQGYGRGGGMAAYSGEQAIVHQMMQDYGVQAFFHGHDHLFTDIVVDKVHYIEAGNAGYPLSFSWPYDYAFTGYGRTRVDVISDEITKFYFININETILAEFTIDRLPPEITLIEPRQSGVFRATSKEFQFMVSDASDIGECNLTLDGDTTQGVVNPAKDIILEFYVNGLAPGLHSWSIKCSDYAFNEDADYYAHNGTYVPNTAESETRTFRILRNPLKKLFSAIPQPLQI